MKRIVYVAFFSLLFFFLLSPVSAAKKRIRVPKAAGVAYSQVKLSRNTNSIVATFLNLGRVRRVDYTLSYLANGVSQGVVGSFVPTGQATEARDLYFGTCSHGVCTPHYGITGASLIVKTTLKSGGTHIKRYRFKGL